MSFSESTLYIMLVFLPGIIAYRIYDELAEHKEYKAYELVIHSFLFGFLSYLLYYIILKIINLFGGSLPFHFLNALTNESRKIDIDFTEILIVSCFSVTVGLGFTAIDKYKLLHRIARRFRITNKHGELDTFSFLMNSNIGNPPFVIIRDVESNRAYYGWIYCNSAGHEKNEFFLRDVLVFENSTARLIMTSPGIYLSKPKEKYVIEFPQLTYGDIMEENILKEVQEKCQKTNQEESQ